jgi:hypothetical protein
MLKCRLKEMEGQEPMAHFCNGFYNREFLRPRIYQCAIKMKLSL